MELLSKTDQRLSNAIESHTRALKGLGEAINEQLAVANGRRKTRTVAIDQVVKCIKSIVDGAEFSTTNGGSVPNAYNYPAESTVAVAARVENEIYWGVKSAPAHAVSPGRAWTCLQPCGSSPVGDVDSKLSAWAKEVNRLTPDQVAAVTFFHLLGKIAEMSEKAKENTGQPTSIVVE